MKVQELIDFCFNDEILPSVDTSDISMDLFYKIERTVDIYDMWFAARGMEKTDGILYSEIYRKWEKNSRRIYSLYCPKIKSEDATKGEIEVNVINKRRQLTGKRTNMKIGRFLSVAYPMISDRDKENISTWLKDTFTPLEAEFHTAEYGFERIITMSQAKRSHFDTSREEKSLADSCMRYTVDELFLESHHPYEAYESGDFLLAYLVKDGLLYGRTLLHKASMTHSAIYAVSKPAVRLLRQNVESLGYKLVDEDGEAWEGAKLLHIEDYAKPDEGADYDLHVVLAPYIDFWDSGSGYSDGQYIHLVRERPIGTSHIDMCCAEGYNEQ